MAESWRNDKKVLLRELVSADHLKIVQVSANILAKLWNKYLAIHNRDLGIFSTVLVRMIYGEIFRWFNYFGIIGYNYNFRTSKGRKRISFYVGLVYRVVVNVPDAVRILIGKRKLFIVSQDLILLKAFGGFIRNLRNLLPYGDRGIVYRNEGAKLKAVKKKNKIEEQGVIVQSVLNRRSAQIRTNKKGLGIVNRRRFLYKNMEFDIDRFEAVYKNDELTLEKLNQLINEIPGYNRTMIKQILMRELGVQRFKDILLQPLNVGRIFTVIRKYKFYEHYREYYVAARRIKKLY